MPILTGGIINYGQRTANPTSPTPTEGSQYWHTTENTQYIYDGTDWYPVKITLDWPNENTVTHWWKSEGIQSATAWNAETGGANFGTQSMVTNNLVYTASDSNFNNNKTISFNEAGDANASGMSLLSGDYWHGSDTAFSVAIVMRKTDHNSGSSLGDGLFTQVYNNATEGGWSVDISGDHTWGGQYGEQVGGISGYNSASNYSTPKKGIFCFRCGANGAASEYKWCPSGSSSFTNLATHGSAPSSLPTNNYTRLTIGNFYDTTSSNHEWSGTIAEIAYWKNLRVDDEELGRFLTYAKAKFNF